MEIGHNVMHGQYDWMGDPHLNSRIYDWDNVCPGEQWKYSHNYIHHTYTNILGKDRDIGYGILRMDEDQKWHPYYLGNPVYALLLMVFFEWGVAMHDLEVENIVEGTRTMEENKALHAGIMRKVRRQVLKDYVLFPALTGPFFPLTLAGNVIANLVRNIWAFNIIFCGHFPAGVETFSQEECRGTRRAATGTTARCSARPTSPAARCSTSCRQPEPPDRAPPLPRPAGPALPGDRGGGAGDLRALRHRRTRPDRCASSSPASRGRSAASPCPIASPRSPTDAGVRRTPDGCVEVWLVLGIVEAGQPGGQPLDGISKSGWASTKAWSCSASHARVTSSSPRRFSSSSMPRSVKYTRRSRSAQ